MKGIGGYVMGRGGGEKCMLGGLVEGLGKVGEYEGGGEGLEGVGVLEEGKGLGWNGVWDMLCLKNNVGVGEELIGEIEK